MQGASFDYFRSRKWRRKIGLKCKRASWTNIVHSRCVFFQLMILVQHFSPDYQADEQHSHIDECVLCLLGGFRLTRNSLQLGQDNWRSSMIPPFHRWFYRRFSTNSPTNPVRTRSRPTSEWPFLTDTVRQRTFSTHRRPSMNISQMTFSLHMKTPSRPHSLPSSHNLILHVFHGLASGVALTVCGLPHFSSRHIWATTQDYVALP